MNNNGACLVLAALTLPGHSAVILPIVVYNLIQHLGAGLVQRFAKAASTAAVRMRHQPGTRRCPWRIT